jgi:hypothetical protein
VAKLPNCGNKLGWSLMVHVWTTAQPRCLLLLGEPVQDRAHNVARKFPDRTDAVEPSWRLGFLLPALIGRILARRLCSLLVLEGFPLVRLRRH